MAQQPPPETPTPQPPQPPPPPDIAGILAAIPQQPQPVVNVTLPSQPGKGKGEIERTRVTKHDEQGRILEFEREVVSDA